MKRFLPALALVFILGVLPSGPALAAPAVEMEAKTPAMCKVIRAVATVFGFIIVDDPDPQVGIIDDIDPIPTFCKEENRPHDEKQTKLRTKEVRKQKQRR